MSKSNNFRNKVCERKMVNFYTDCESLRITVCNFSSRCIQNFPAVGWVQGDSDEIPIDIEAKIEKYMQKHTVSKDDIESFLTEDTIILDGDNSSSHSVDKFSEFSLDIISLTEIRTMFEEFAKKLPKIR